MPRVTDTVTDEAGRPVPRARVLITRLVTAQDDTTGRPARTELVWSGRAGADGTYTAVLPGQVGEYTAIVSRLREERFTLDDIDDRVQQLVDRLVRPRTPRPSRPSPRGR